MSVKVLKKTKFFLKFLKICYLHTSAETFLLDLLQKDLNTSNAVYCRGTRAKKLNSVLFCPSDWQPCL